MHQHTHAMYTWVRRWDTNQKDILHGWHERRPLDFQACSIRPRLIHSVSRSIQFRWYDIVFCRFFFLVYWFFFVVVFMATATSPSSIGPHGGNARWLRTFFAAQHSLIHSDGCAQWTIITEAEPFFFLFFVCNNVSLFFYLCSSMCMPFAMARIGMRKSTVCPRV